MAPFGRHPPLQWSWMPPVTSGMRIASFPFPQVICFVNLTGVGPYPLGSLQKNFVFLRKYPLGLIKFLLGTVSSQNRRYIPPGMWLPALLRYHRFESQKCENMSALWGGKVLWLFNLLVAIFFGRNLEFFCIFYKYYQHWTL